MYKRKCYNLDVKLIDKLDKYSKKTGLKKITIIQQALERFFNENPLVIVLLIIVMGILEGSFFVC